MSQTSISIIIKELLKLVVEGNTNPHILLQKELTQLNSANFSQENKDLKEDVLNYLSEVKTLITNLSKIQLSNYNQFLATISDKDEYYRDVITPIINSLYTKVTASSGDFSNKIVSSIVNQVRSSITSISLNLKAIKDIVTKLKETESKLQQPTTPTAVATNSVKDVDDLVKRICNLNTFWAATNYPEFVAVRDRLIDDKETFCKDSNEINANTYINSARSYIEEAKAFINDSLFKVADFIDSTEDNAKIYRDNITAVESVIQDLNKFISIKKESSKDTKVNPPKPLPTVTQKSTAPSKTTSTKNNTSTTPTNTKPTKNQTPNAKKPTTKTPTNTKPTTKTPQLKELPVEEWGIRFTTKQPEVAANQSPFSSYYMSLLPARQSTVPIQGGRDVPNAMPGLNFKFVPAVGKQQIPGFSPIYQNLGVKGLQVIIVGAFTGADGEEKTLVDDPKAFGSNRFSSTLGGRTVADNPFREPKAELNAYNSYLAFQKLAYEGKQIEVEINTAQVYRDIKSSPHAASLKLQDPTSGNPQFTAVIRNLDVYHATQERTWYTLVLDVTDFNMASKTNINLNNSLQAAIDKAKVDLKTAKDQEGTTENGSESNALVPEANVPNSEQAQLIDQVNKIVEGINNISDPKKRLNQELCYEHLVGYLKYIQESRLYYFKDYITGKPPQGLTSWFTGILGSIGRTAFDDVTFRLKGDILWVRARIFCRVVSFTGVVLGCKEEIYWKLNFNATDGNYITRYTRVLDGDQNQTIKPLEDECEGNSSSFDGDISGLIGWNANTFKDIAGKVGGCAAASAVLSSYTTIVGAKAGSVAGPAGTAAGAIAGFGTTFIPAVTACGFDVLGEAWQRTQEFNKDSDTAIDNFVSYFFANLIIGGASAIGSSVIRRGTKQGTSIPSSVNNNASQSVTQTIVNQTDDLLTRLKGLPDVEDALKNQTITVTKNGVSKSVTITKVKSRGDLILLTADDGIIYTGKEVTNVPESVFTQPSVTTTTNSPTASDPTQTSTGGSSSPVSQTTRLDNAIKALFLPDKVEQSILNLSTNNKRAVLTLINRYGSRGTKDISIKVGGNNIFIDDNIIIDSSTDLRFTEAGVIIGRNNTNAIPYSQIESSSFITPTVTTTPPQQPVTQNPQPPVPEGQTTTTNTPDPVSQPVVQQPQPVVTNPSQVSWIDDFNRNPQSFRNKATPVTELETTLEQRRLGANVNPIMQPNSRGSYWVVEQTTNQFSLTYKPNIRLNEFNYNAFSSYFDVPSTLPSGKTPILISPAELTKIGDNWVVTKKGVVNFR